jgi:magnesium transporter
MRNRVPASVSNQAKLLRMRAADVAEALNRLEPEEAAAAVAALPFDLAVRLLDIPEFDQYHAVFPFFSNEKAKAFLDAMSADRRADVMRSIRPAQSKRLLGLLDPDVQQSLSVLLQYAPDSAGGIMTTEFVSIPSDWTVKQAVDHVTAVARQKETIYAMYVIDVATGHIHSAVSLRDLLTSDPQAVVSSVQPDLPPIVVDPQCGRDEAARLIGKYNLLAVPVVDSQQKVVGIVTVDDVIDELVRERTSDVQRFGGMEALDVHYNEALFSDMIRKRAGWLCALFLGEMLTATAMGHFESEISKATVLALFIPLIISSGGNSGSQATSLIIRAMALHELGLRDWLRVAARELPSGLVLGGILGVIGVARILLWEALGWYDYGPHYGLVAATVGIALVGVVAFGSLAGSMLPFVIRRLGFDPASASAPLVATLVDVTGLIIYFTVAYVVLRGTIL